MSEETVVLEFYKLKSYGGPGAVCTGCAGRDNEWLCARLPDCGGYETGFIFRLKADEYVE